KAVANELPAKLPRRANDRLIIGLQDDNQARFRMFASPKGRQNMCRRRDPATIINLGQLVRVLKLRERIAVVCLTNAANQSLGNTELWFQQLAGNALAQRIQVFEQRMMQN